MITNHLIVACAFCAAEIGEPCKTKGSGKITSTHKCRFDAANTVAVSETVVAMAIVGVAQPAPIEPERQPEPEQIEILEISEESKLVQPTEITPRQVLHVVAGGGSGRQYRTYFNGNPADFDMSKHFKVHETRAYLERYMPCSFAVVSENDLDIALGMLEDGIKANLEDGKTFEGEFLTGFVKGGDGATIIMTPVGQKVTLASIKVRCMIKSTKDVGKFMKYLKRLFAMYRHATFGTDQVFSKDQFSDLLSYTIDGKRMRIRFDSPLPKGKTIEGCSYVDLRFARAHFGKINPDTGKPWKQGDTARITFTCNGFMWKGHVMVWRMRNIDATFWDCKRVIGTDDVFVGFMGTLHAGSLHMGLQEYVDWGLHKFGEQLAKLAVEEYSDKMEREDIAESMFKRIFEDKDLNDPEVLNQIARWRFMNAHKHGFNFRSEPFMWRDAYRAYKKNVLDVTRGRVPVPEEWGFRAYYFIDPWCINDDGIFHPRMQRLVGNCVYSRKLRNGEQIVTWRNPHTVYEYVIAYAVAPAPRRRTRNDGTEYEHLFDMISDQVMIVSIDIYMDFAEIQGGGDYDDCGNCYKHKPILDHFKNRLAYYPAKVVIEKKKADIRDVLKENFLAARHGYATNLDYDKQAVMDAIRAVKDADASIGMIDNYLRHLMVLSVHADANMANLNQQLAAAAPGSAEHKRIATTIVWYQQFLDTRRYDEKKIAAALEDAIDNCAMNGSKGDIDNNLGKEIRDFWKDCKIVFYWETLIGKSGFSKVPGRCMANDPVVVMDPISESIKVMEAYGAALDEHVKIAQWRNLGMAPAAIRSYPCTRDVHQAVNKGWTNWKQTVREIWESPASEKKAYQDFIAFCGKHEVGLTRRGEEFTRMFLAELERRIYTGKHGKPVMVDGKVIDVPDAYLNNPKFFGYRVQLYKQLGLNGLTPDTVVNVDVDVEEEAEQQSAVEPEAIELIDAPAPAEESYPLDFMPETPIDVYEYLNGLVA